MRLIKIGWELSQRQKRLEKRQRKMSRNELLLLI
jgi:hypothetical protein